MSVVVVVEMLQFGNLAPVDMAVVGETKADMVATTNVCSSFFCFFNFTKIFFFYQMATTVVVAAKAMEVMAKTQATIKAGTTKAKVAGVLITEMPVVTAAAMVVVR